MEEVLRAAPQEIRRDEIELEGQVGAGAFATVSRARCRGTTVAVKQAKTSFFHGLTPEQVKAFVHEVRVLSKLAHPNLVQFMGVCVVPEKELLIVTEFLDEGNLEERLLGPAELPLYTRMKWALQAGAGLAWLHGSGVLHLDIKPSNMLLRQDTVKLCDFGLSKLLPPGKHFKSSKIVGTPVYCAPEVLSGDVFDHKADVYSFGATLVVIATRAAPRLANERAYESRERFVEAVCKNGERPRCPGMQGSLKQLLDWCWEAQPARRPTAAQCVEKLEMLLIESATKGDEAGALVWHKLSGGQEVKDAVPFAAFCASLFEVAECKKDVDSRTAILIKAVLHTMGGGDDSVVTLVDFGRMCGLLGPINRSFPKRVKSLTKMPWFFAGTSTADAEKLLLPQGSKTFLVRFSSSGCNFTLSYVNGGKVWHTRIKHEHDKFELEGTNQVFDSLEAVVASATKYKNDILAVAPFAGSPFALLWQRQRNQVGGYKDFAK